MSEIDNADELVVAELIFNGTFHGIDKYRLAALLSSLVPVEQSNVRNDYGLNDIEE